MFFDWLLLRAHGNSADLKTGDEIDYRFEMRDLLAGLSMRPGILLLALTPNHGPCVLRDSLLKLASSNPV